MFIKGQKYKLEKKKLSRILQTETTIIYLLICLPILNNVLVLYCYDTVKIVSCIQLSVLVFT